MADKEKGVLIRVPLYLYFEPERKNASVQRLIDWAHENIVPIDFDTEDSNPGFQSAIVIWDEAGRAAYNDVANELIPREGVNRPDRGPPVEITLYDASGNLIEGAVLPAGQAGDRARQFVILHGSDPDKRGKDAMSGSITFRPAKE